MSSNTLVIGPVFPRRHLWPLVAVAIYLLVIAAIELLGFGPTDTLTVVPPDGRVAVVLAPVSTIYFYYLAVFSFGLEGDLAARRSIYPARMFTLPVTTEKLAWAPMRYGMVTVACLLFAAALLGRWPYRVEMPLIWPPLLAAVFLAWTQALMWMPYGLPGVRVIATVLWLSVLDGIVILAAHFEVSEAVMVAILAPQIPLAYLVARAAVARARRGDVPDWAPNFARFFRGTGRATRQRHPFASPHGAQAWFEWRRQGRTLPVLVAIVLPFELAILWLAQDARALVLEILILVLITPPLLASFAPTTVSKANPNASAALGVAPFTATRPMTSAALVGARLTVALWSTLAAWLVVAVATTIALQWSGTLPMMAERVSRVVEVFGVPRASVLALLILLVLMATTWKQLVQSLYIGLSGREWLIRSSALAALAFIIFIAPVAQWIIDHKSAQAALWVAIPSILGVLVALKMLAAGLVAVPLTRSGLLSDRALMIGAAGWVAVVFALYGVLGWLFEGPLIPRYFLLLFSIAVVPLARTSAAPLALAWNRHR